MANLSRYQHAFMYLCNAIILLLQLLFLFISIQSTGVTQLLMFYHFITKFLLSQLLTYYLATANKLTSFYRYSCYYWITMLYTVLLFHFFFKTNLVTFKEKN